MASLTLDGRGAHRVLAVDDELRAAMGWSERGVIGLPATEVVDERTLDLLGLVDADVRFEHSTIVLLDPAGTPHAFPAQVMRRAPFGIGTIELAVQVHEDPSGSTAADAASPSAFTDGEIVFSAGRVQEVSPNAARLLAAAGQHEVVGQPIARFLRDDERRRLERVLHQCTLDATLVACTGLSLRGLSGEAVAVTARLTGRWVKGAAALLMQLQQRNDDGRLRRRGDIDDAVSEAIISTDANFVIESWNRGAEALYGWAMAEAVGRTVPDLIGTGEPDLDVAAAASELFRAGEWRGMTTQRRRDGTTVRVRAFTRLLRDADGSIVGIISVNSPDQSSVERLDALTGTATRDVLFERLLPTDESGLRAIVMLDLDDFSAMNARFGVRHGDTILTTLATRLRDALRTGDLLARVGADRFAALCTVVDESEARGLASRLEQCARHPFDLDGQVVELSASVGAAFGTSVAGTALFEQAERALRDATVRGGRQIRFFDHLASPDDWDDDQQFVADVRRALAGHEFRVAYQPIVDLRDGSMLKVEALARWTHHTRGEIPPTRFIPMAERTGVIREIGEWIMRTACASVAAATPALPPDLELAVNVSVVQLGDPAFPERVQQILAESGLAANRLWIEVTESVLVDAASIPPLLALNAAGMRLAIDDFGTGYSSLQYLSRLPVEALKIDRSFVSGLGVDARDTAIVRSVINLSRDLGVQTIAEGVETEMQAAQLVTLTCDAAQGWLYGRAEPLTSLLEWAAVPTVAPARPVPPVANEAARLEALAATEILDSAAERVFDSFTQLASRLFDSPMALISLVDRDRQWFKSNIGVDATQTPRNVAFCAHAIARPDEVMIVPDARADTRFADNPLVTGPPHIRFYAGAPIRSREHLGLGTLCILDTEPRTISDEDVQVLQALADQASALMDLRRRTAELGARVRHDSSLGAAGAPLESLAVNNSADVLIVIDRNATITYLNDAVRSLLGHEPLDWIGRNALELVHPNDLGLAVRSLTERAVTSGQHRPLSLRVRRADSGWTMLELSSRTVIGVPGLDGIVLSGREVGSRDGGSDERLWRSHVIDAALDHLSEGVVACDANGVLTEFNLAARRLHGQPGRPLPAAEWAGTYFLRVADGSRQLRLEEIPLYRALQGEHVVDADIQIAPPGVAPKLIRCNGQPLRDRSESISGAVIAMRELDPRERSGHN